MRLCPRRFVERIANGHLMVSWPDAGSEFFALVGIWLRLRHGLRRDGHRVESVDDILLPDFVGAGVRLSAGWSNWDGYYLLAVDDAADRFLGRWFSRRPGLAS